MWAICLLRLTHMFDRTGLNMQISSYQFVSVRICSVPFRYVRIEFIRLLAEHFRMIDLGIGRFFLISQSDLRSTEYRCIFLNDEFLIYLKSRFCFERLRQFSCDKVLWFPSPRTHCHWKWLIVAWKISREKSWCKWISRDKLSCERFRNEHVRQATFLFSIFRF